MRSATLVDTLKKHLDHKEPLKAVPFTDIALSERDERTYSSGSSPDIFCTPPNSPASNDTCSSSSPTPAFTLGMVKVPTMSLGLKKIGAEFELKPELPLRKSKEPFNCHYCGMKFPFKSTLNQHISFHRPQRPYQCEHDGCVKSYKTRSELNRHTIAHTGQKNHVCKQCGKKLLRKQYLKTHLLRHSEPLTWQCTLCSKIFVSEEDLSKHKVTYHKIG